MNTRQILSILLIMLGTIAAILPADTDKVRKFTWEELETEVKNEMYFVSADELAHLIIAGDPSFNLIDIRRANEADSMIARAINIPNDSLLSPSFAGFFYQSGRKSILYSDDLEALEDAWMRLKYEGYSEVYILKGGLSAWKTDILNPQYPGSSAPQDAIDLYSQRIAARQYFSGAKPLPKVELKIVLPAGGRKRQKVQGGCS